jgi:hypothetical protein
METVPKFGIRATLSNAGELSGIANRRAFIIEKSNTFQKGRKRYLWLREISPHLVDKIAQFSRQLFGHPKHLPSIVDFVNNYSTFCYLWQVVFHIAQRI